MKCAYTYRQTERLPPLFARACSIKHFKSAAIVSPSSKPSLGQRGFESWRDSRVMYDLHVQSCIKNFTRVGAEVLLANREWNKRGRTAGSAACQITTERSINSRGGSETLILRQKNHCIELTDLQSTCAQSCSYLSSLLCHFG